MVELQLGVKLEGVERPSEGLVSDMMPINRQGFRCY